MFSLPFSFSSLPALPSRLGLDLMLAAAGTGSALYLFPSPSLPDFRPCLLFQKKKRRNR